MSLPLRLVKLFEDRGAVAVIRTAALSLGQLSQIS